MLLCVPKHSSRCSKISFAKAATTVGTFFNRSYPTELIFFAHGSSPLCLCIEFDIATILASIRKNSRRLFYAPKAFTSTPTKSSRQISYLHFSTTLITFLNFLFIHFLFHIPLNNALFSVKNDAHNFSSLSPLFFGLFHQLFYALLFVRLLVIENRLR